VKIKFFSIISFWLLFAVFMTGVMTLVHPITNRPAPVWDEFIWELAFAVTWIAGTPVVLWIANRFSLRHSNRIRNSILLLTAGIGLSTVQCTLHGIIIYASRPDIHAFNVNIILSSLFYNIDKMLIVYCGLAILQHAMDFYRSFQEKELKASRLETQLSQAQMMALKMQLQPHFLFNTLNAIVTLIHKNPDLAEETIVRLSDFLRITLDASGKQIVTLKEELEFITAYLSIEEVRFNGRLTYRNLVEPELFDAQVPMLIVQPLVENAIKHGFSQFEGSSVLEISAVKKNSSLTIIVQDDAAPSLSLQNMREGIGLTNIRSRLQALYGEAASLTISPNTSRGVRATLNIPYSSVQV